MIVGSNVGKTTRLSTACLSDVKSKITLAWVRIHDIDIQNDHNENRSFNLSLEIDNWRQTRIVIKFVGLSSADPSLIGRWDDRNEAMTIMLH